MVTVTPKLPPTAAIPKARRNTQARRVRREDRKAQPETHEAEPQPPLPADRMEWAAPLDEDELRALKAGWGFME
ncbi:hypothetical protein [Methylobacterium sp. NEAU K]|uniref:hypothetical protein n=1 Tax=Methylobacterium sp. NEAU K TaxID=3064946 RepID=UPI00273426F8|nr:hypothetical protein [Methylobacterium sp. NEAU K]MDP4003320.1 hypothetical protein [Methylobacterium sp. NEAU K]